MGVQAYSDMLGMGDLPNQGAVGIFCLTCDTHWRDKAAFDRGEVDPGEEIGPSEDVGTPDEVEPVDDGDGE
jgi:hypothetical protein